MVGKSSNAAESVLILFKKRQMPIYMYCHNSRVILGKGGSFILNMKIEKLISKKGYSLLHRWDLHVCVYMCDICRHDAMCCVDKGFPPVWIRSLSLVSQ